MSEHSAHAPGHGGHGTDHVPHVLPLKLYLATWGALMVLTVLTVAASYFNFGGWNLIIALAIATLKAMTVALMFMHLWFDHRFHAVILASSLVFLAIFIGFTMFDTETRGRANAIAGEHPADISKPFAGTRAEAEMKARAKEMEKKAGPTVHASEVKPAGEAAPAAPVAPAASGSGAPGASAAPAGSAAPATSAKH